MKIIIREYYETEEDGKIYKFYHDMPVIIGNEITRIDEERKEYKLVRLWPNVEYREVKRKRKKKNEPYSLIKGECPICGEEVIHGYATGPRDPHCSCSEYYVYEKNAEPGTKNPYPFYDELIKRSLETKKNVVVEGDEIKDMLLGFKYVRIEVLYDESKALEILEGYEKVGSK